MSVPALALQQGSRCALEHITSGCNHRAEQTSQLLHLPGTDRNRGKYKEDTTIKIQIKIKSDSTAA